MLLYRARMQLRLCLDTGWGSRMTDKGRVTCRDTTWLASDARDRPLTEREQVALAEHIAECNLCQGASNGTLFREVGAYLKGEAPDTEA